MNANHLSGARGIYGADLAFGFDALTADGQVILAAQLDSDRGQRGLHLARVFRCLEVGKWFIHKPALGRARLNRGGEFLVAIAHKLYQGRLTPARVAMAVARPA